MELVGWALPTQFDGWMELVKWALPTQFDGWMELVGWALPTQFDGVLEFGIAGGRSPGVICRWVEGL